MLGWDAKRAGFTSVCFGRGLNLLGFLCQPNLHELKNATDGIFQRFRKRAIVTAITCSAVLAGCDGLCSNEPIASVTSPSDAHKVVVFTRGCGATTGWSTQVSILRGSEHLWNESGNTLVVEGKSPVSVDWKSDSVVTLSGMSSGRLFKQERAVNGITVTYE